MLKNVKNVARIKNVIENVFLHLCTHTHTHRHTRSWLASVVVRLLDLRLDGREFDSRLLRLILRWVTVFGRANHLSISPSCPSQLSLLPSAGREMSTG